MKDQELWWGWNLNVSKCPTTDEKISKFWNIQLSIMQANDDSDYNLVTWKNSYYKTLALNIEKIGNTKLHVHYN